MSNVSRNFSERLESAIQLYLSNESFSIADCAEESYVSASVLHKTLKKRGLTRNQSERWAANLERAIEIYCNEGLSVYAASKKAGVGNGTLGEALKARGLSRSPQSNKPDVELEIYSAEFKESRGYSKALQLLHRSARQHQAA
ncbi:hypothetical protein PQI64_12765 [Shewanella bicestrii]